MNTTSMLYSKLHKIGDKIGDNNSSCTTKRTLQLSANTKQMNFITLTVKLSHMRDTWNELLSGFHLQCGTIAFGWHVVTDRRRTAFRRDAFAERVDWHSARLVAHAQSTVEGRFGNQLLLSTSAGFVFVPTSKFLLLLPL